MKILSFENTKEKFLYFFWYFAHLIVSLRQASKVLSLENEKKTSFSFAFCSLIRTFAK